MKQAEGELEVIPYYFEHRVWEVKEMDELMEEDDLMPTSNIPLNMFKDPYMKAVLKKDREIAQETQWKEEEMAKDAEQLLKEREIDAKKEKEEAL